MPPLGLSHQTELLHSSFTSFDYEHDAKDVPLPLTYEEAPLQNVRNVRFSRYDEVFEIPHIDDISDDEINDVWMSSEDGSKIRRDCQSIVLMLNSSSANLKGIEKRGLEQHARSSTEQRRAVQDLLYEAVDRIQTFQDEKGVEASHLIAELCQKISAVSIQAARRAGTQDAIAAYG